MNEEDLRAFERQAWKRGYYAGLSAAFLIALLIGAIARVAS